MGKLELKFMLLGKCWERRQIKNRNTFYYRVLRFIVVVPPGLEPGTT